jgi:hypothetical protein
MILKFVDQIQRPDAERLILASGHQHILRTENTSHRCLVILKAPNRPITNSRHNVQLPAIGPNQVFRPSGGVDKTRHSNELIKSE